MGFREIFPSDEKRLIRFQAWSAARYMGNINSVYITAHYVTSWDATLVPFWMTLTDCRLQRQAAQHWRIKINVSLWHYRVKSKVQTSNAWKRTYSTLLFFHHIKSYLFAMWSVLVCV